MKTYKIRIKNSDVSHLIHVNDGIVCEDFLRELEKHKFISIDVVDRSSIESMNQIGNIYVSDIAGK